MIRSAVFALTFAAGAAAFADEWQLEKAEGSLKISRGDVPLMAFHSDWRVPYVYPLRSPSGANLTRHWPMDEGFAGEERDHPHHRSLWLAHGAVNGYDFWAFHDGKGAAIEHRGFATTKADGNSATFTADLAWTAGGKTHLVEKRTHTLRWIDGKTRLLDVTSELTAADGDVVFGDTKEGMFALRLDRSLRVSGPVAQAELIDSEGRSGGEVWGKRARWIATHGPDETGEPAVVAMFDHPENLRHPTWWHARDYGLLAANPFGIHDFENLGDERPGEHVLKQGDVLVFRYRLLMHHGELPAAAIDKRWQEFAQPDRNPENP